MVTSSVVLLLVALAFRPTGGANCSEGSGCGHDECPPDSVLLGEEECRCFPERCSSPPRCHYNTLPRLAHKASGVPGDCCDIHECVPPPEVNCTGVVCEEGLKECPADSYRLPGVVGPCCTSPQGCACLPIPCQPAPCHEAHVLSPGTGQPGSCCPKYSCSHQQVSKKSCSTKEGKQVKDGSSWKEDECRRCACHDGKIVCGSSCPPLPPNCTDTAVPKGQCCPVCIPQQGEGAPGGCRSGHGIIHENGATWNEDDCTSCTCKEGSAKCQAAMCIQSCPNATYVKGECCPRCNDNGESVVGVPPECPPITNCTLKCKNGVEQDASNCFICKCKEECGLECPRGFVKDKDGNNMCECEKRIECPSLDNCRRKCRHGYRTDTETGCLQCKCHHCKPVPNCSKRCPHGLATDYRNCPTCKCKPSSQLSSNNTVAENGGHCFTAGGEKKDDGEAWFDGCRQCYCLGGREMCALVSCPRLPCPEPVLSKGACCPSCPGNESIGAGGGSGVVCYSPGGGIRQEGEMWKLGKCIECVCHSGSVLCHRRGVECPPAPCTRPSRAQCCPTCPPLPQPPTHALGCGDGRPAGASWKEGPCVSCVCTNGVASCYTQTCETDTTCSTPVQVKDQCCPLCFDNGLEETEEEETCRVGNVTFSVGDEWEPKQCMRCVCQVGRTVTCTQQLCDSSCPDCPDGSGSGGGRWWSEAFYLALVCTVVCLSCAAIALTCHKVCHSRHHKLTLTPPYHYKYVPTYPAPEP